MHFAFKNMDLKTLAKMYLERFLSKSGKQFKIVEVNEDSKMKKYLDFVILVPSTGERIGVLVKDWKKSVGVDVIIRFSRVLRELNFTMGIIIANRFSDLAMDRLKRSHEIVPLTRSQIITDLINEKFLQLKFSQSDIEGFEQSN